MSSDGKLPRYVLIGQCCQDNRSSGGSGWDSGSGNGGSCSRNCTTEVTIGRGEAAAAAVTRMPTPATKSEGERPGGRKRLRACQPRLPEARRSGGRQRLRACQPWLPKARGGGDWQGRQVRRKRRQLLELTRPLAQVKYRHCPVKKISTHFNVLFQMLIMRHVS
jgi:hypothetical protein